MARDNLDVACAAMVYALDDCEMTMQEVGERMGYSKNIARKSVWQLLNKTNDPRLSMVRRFCKAVGVSVSQVVYDCEYTDG